MQIDAALTDVNLLGGGLGDPATWHSWLTILKAAYGLPLTEDETVFFRSVTGGRSAPAQRVSLVACAIGRRAGKSRVAAALAVYEALFSRHKLAAGERGTVLVLAPSKSQAGVVFSYALGFLESSPFLQQQIDSVTSDTIRLAGNIEIAVHAASFRSVRGRTLLACILDEVAYFMADEFCSNPDKEIYRAVQPALAQSGGLCVAISSPYRKAGLLFDWHRQFFGSDDPQRLFVQAPASVFNANLDEGMIARALIDDSQAARSEWLAEFRNDIASFLDDDLIDAALDCDRPLELPPREGCDYFGFTDPSGGRNDSYTLSIAHKEQDRIIVDVVRGRTPPFDPREVTKEYAALLRDYGLRDVRGDNYSGEWAVEAWRSAGVTYHRSELSASELYREALPLFARHAVSIPDYAPLARELRQLERRSSRMGRDLISHPQGGHDDHANAVAGVMQAMSRPSRSAVAQPMPLPYASASWTRPHARLAPMSGSVRVADTYLAIKWRGR